MSPPWMPLYIADYRADSAHLNAAEHGAYLNLIMHYWTTGGLPDDDRQLARIACMTARQWGRARPTIQAFFHDGWEHGRIKRELKRLQKVSLQYQKKASHAARKRWNIKDGAMLGAFPKHASSMGTTTTVEEANASSTPKEAKSASLGARKRATRLSAEWWPSLENVNYAIGKGLNQQRINVEAEKFRNYWIAKSGTGATKLDWDATWQNWILNACERNGAPGNGPTGESLSDRAFQLAERARSAERARGVDRPAKPVRSD